MTAEDFIKTSIIQNESSIPNSIIYSCFNNDPIAIDQTFSKFVIWIRNLIKTNSSCEDLELIIGPLFCHMYLDVFVRGHIEQAANFFKNHLPSVDKSKCDSLINSLINDLNDNNLDSLNTKDFRTNKYLVRLKIDSLKILNEYLAESGHVVLLQIFQSWFALEQYFEEQEDEVIEALGDEDSSDEEFLCAEDENTRENTELSIHKLENVIDALKADAPPLYSIHIANVKDDITCARLNRQSGVFAYSCGNSIILRSIQTLKQLENNVIYGEIGLLGHADRIYDIAFFKEFQYLVSGSQDNTVRLFDLNDYNEKMVYVGHQYPIYCVVPSRNGAYIASGSYDRSARLWSVLHKETLRVFCGHTQEVTSIDFHSNCTLITTGSADKHIRLWSTKDALPVRLMAGSEGTVYALSCTPNGKYLVSSGEDNILRVWDIMSTRHLAEVRTGSCPVIKIAISDDGSAVATGSIDGTVKVWDLISLTKKTHEKVVEPIHNIQLNFKLLSLDYFFGTFGCLTGEHNVSLCA